MFVVNIHSIHVQHTYASQIQRIIDDIDERNKVLFEKYTAMTCKLDVIDEK